jgi:hypothetical protein
MPPVPQCSPYGASNDDADARHLSRGEPAHLTMTELAARWRRKRKTIERHYTRWGLRPLRFGGRLLFPLDQVHEVEARAMRGELVQSDRIPPHRMSRPAVGENGNSGR